MRYSSPFALGAAVQGAPAAVLPSGPHTIASDEASAGVAASPGAAEEAPAAQPSSEVPPLPPSS
jgi:hypothetical protein